MAKQVVTIMLRVIVYFSALLALAFANNTRAYAMTLGESFVAAYEDNPQLLAERARLRSVDEEMSQALSHWRPSANIAVSYGRALDQVSGGTVSEDQFYSGQNPPSSYSLTVTQPLYRGGQTEAGIREAFATIKSERAVLINTEQQVFLAVATDYSDVVLDERTLELDIQNVDVLEGKLKSANERFSGGEFSRIDVAEIQAAYQQAVVTKISAEAALAKAKASFVRDVGSDIGSPKDVDISEWYLKPSENIADIISRENPQVIAAELKQDAAQAAADEILDQAVPQVSLVGTAAHQDGASFNTEHENILSAIVRLTVPLYSGGALESQSRAAVHQISVYRAQVESERRSAIATASSAMSQIQADKASHEASANQIAANQLMLEGVQRQLEGGEKSVLDVLNAQQSLLQSRISILTSEHDEVIAKFTLASALGRATAQWLRIPVDYYDPVRNYLDVKDRWFGFEP